MPKRISAIRARAFRGVPNDITLPLPRGGSVVILGENGTGKSTVADAVELYFTGRLPFLAREGRQSNVRHVGANDATETTVDIETTGSLGGQATSETCTNMAAREIGLRETLVLRGRSLVEFIERPKAEKWKFLFEILGLGDVEQFRLDLQNASNALSGEAERGAVLLKSAERALAPLAPDGASVLGEFHSLCEQAGVAAPVDLQDALKPDRISGLNERQLLIQKVAKLRALDAELATAQPVPSVNIVKAWNTLITSVGSAEVTRLQLFEIGAEIITRTPDIDRCPLCDQSVEAEDFRRHIESTLHVLSDAAKRMENGRGLLARYVGKLRAVHQVRANARENADKFGIGLPPVPDLPIRIIDDARARGTQLDIDSIERAMNQVPNWDRDALQAIRDQIPASDPRDDALVRVGQLVEKTKTWQGALEASRRANVAADAAKKVCDAYTAEQNRFFAAVIEQVSKRLAEIYERLHPHEGLGNVRVETWGNKGLELAMDFHGHPQRPPHGVLSESHLNSLAIALFLAMAETFNDRLRFLVLDDVVNSFDVEHRGALAELLTDEYSDWQLIVLTHDPVFYQQLARRNSSWTKYEVTSCTFDDGPRFRAYQSGSLLEKANDRLVDGDARGAATGGRRALEDLLQEACEGMSAPLPFRRGQKNDHREIGELIPGLRRVHKTGSRMPADLDKMLTDADAHAQAVLNIESHASPWHASAMEVRAALESIAALDEFWTCANCRSRVWALGDVNGWRCKCGQTSYPESRLGDLKVTPVPTSTQN